MDGDVPLSATDASIVVGFGLVAVSVAASLWPAAAGAYVTVTEHVFPDFKETAEQLFAVIENAGDPVSEMPKPADDELVGFASVNCCETV
jgi:hypothetical protein